MFESSTVFVLGAGASMPYGFPSAFGLLQAVVGACRREPEHEALRDLGLFDRVRIDAFRDDLSRSGFNSVDYFLECRPDYLELGRALIAMCIARLETDQHYFVRPEGEPGGPAFDDPYRHLLNSLWDPANRTILSGRVSFVTFNYDRSLEHYLAKAIEVRRRCSYEDALTEVERVPIIHVYGSLGTLKRDSGPGSRYRPFGSDRWRDVDLNMRSISQLRLIGDDRGVPANATAADPAAALPIRECRRIIFLGFGYDEANLQRIKPANRPAPVQIFGTTLGLAAKEAGTVHSLLAKWGEHGSKQGTAQPCSQIKLCETRDRKSEAYLREAIRL